MRNIYSVSQINAYIRNMFDQLNGPSESNEMMAEFLTQQAQDLPFMNQK